MTITSKKQKRPSNLAKSRKEIDSEKLSKEERKKMVKKIALFDGTYKDIMEEFKRQTGESITRPTIGKYLKEDPEFEKGKAERSKKRTLNKKWKKDFVSDRVRVKPIFRKDYLSAGDGICRIPDEDKIIEMPSKEPLKAKTGEPVVLNKAFYKRVENKYKITFTKAGQFGYDDDKGENATFDASIRPIIMKQLEEKLKDDPDKDKKLKELAEQIDKMDDSRSDLLFGPKILDRNLCPGWSTSDKTTRGRTRMLAMEGIDNETGEPYVFSRAVMNIPELLRTHPKRIGVSSHNISKESATLLKSEEPIVKARFNDVPGVNLRVRMPRRAYEELMTEESAVIISKKAAKKMRYFAVVEEGSIITDNIDKLPDTYRSDKKVKTYEDIKDHLIESLEVHRGELIIMNAIEDLEGAIAESQASHSGKLILIGEPTEHIRNLTVDPDKDPQGRNTRPVRFYRQNYQIVREDELHRGDKVLARGGIKSVISDIRDDLGYDEKGRPYEMIINYTDVWRKADPNEPDYALKEETFIRQGKKKSSVVLEHKDANGKMFTFLIDKFAQDEGSKLPMRISTTFMGGLWELAVSKVLDKPRYTNAELKEVTQRFVEDYIREPSTMITSLKALHYRLVEVDDKIQIQVDPNEPIGDKNGRILPLRHEANGKVYHTIYLPNFISRLYRDARTLRERFMLDLADEKPEHKVAQWDEIVKTIKNSTYLFPKIQESKELVVIPYVNTKKSTDINTIRMDALDVAEAGGDPKDPNLKLSWRKEPVTNKASLQTANVVVDFSGKYRGVVGIHVESAKKAVLDYDGDQVVVFRPAIIPAMIKPTDEEKKYLKDLRNKDYSQKTFESLYDETRQVKYADNEKELSVKCAGYNQTIARLESRLIQQFGGRRRSALLLYKSERPPKIVIGEGSTKREFELTPGLVNRVCDVEKVLKMREPYWHLQALYDKKWKDLTESERDLVEDMHVRRVIMRLTTIEQKNDPNVRLLGNILRKEHSFVTEEGLRRERKIEPLGLIIDPKSSRLLDQILAHQIKISGLEIFKEKKE